MTWMVRNRAYLGWAHQHGAVNRNAHPAIVTQLEFDRANAVRVAAPNTMARCRRSCSCSDSSTARRVAGV